MLMKKTPSRQVHERRCKTEPINYSSSIEHQTLPASQMKVIFISTNLSEKFDQSTSEINHDNHEKFSIISQVHPPNLSETFEEILEDKKKIDEEVSHQDSIVVKTQDDLDSIKNDSSKDESISQDQNIDKQNDCDASKVEGEEIIINCEKPREKSSLELFKEKRHLQKKNENLSSPPRRSAVVIPLNSGSVDWKTKMKNSLKNMPNFQNNTSRKLVFEQEKIPEQSDQVNFFDFFKPKSFKDAQKDVVEELKKCSQ